MIVPVLLLLSFLTPDYQSNDDWLQDINDVRSNGAWCGGVWYPPVIALKTNAVLSIASVLHANDMAVNSFYSHYSLNGDSPSDRVAKLDKYKKITGEAIHINSSGWESAFKDFMSSPGHCRIIMSWYSRDLGIGHVYRNQFPQVNWWVLDFGR